MSAATYHLVLEAGVDFAITITYKDSAGAAINLTGYTGKMQIRNSPSSSILITKQTSDASMVLGGAAGTVAFTLTAADCTTLSTQLVPMKWDILLTPSGVLGIRLVEGNVTSKPAITV